MKNHVYKIYSRKRFKFFNKKIENKYKKLIFLMIIIIVIFLIGIFIWESIKPVFEVLCEDKAKGIATKITNQETSKVLTKYNYNAFFTIEKDNNGDVQMITANVLQINQVTSDIALDIQESLENESNNRLYIASGNLTGIKILAGLGPKIPVKISTVGNITTDIKSEFISQGVNQTLHRIYMNIVTCVNILTPFGIITRDIINQVLIAENIILGNIPATYYNLDGFENSSDLLEIVE